nr:serine/threonine-protein kinase [Parafrankia irregularis]
MSGTTPSSVPGAPLSGAAVTPLGPHDPREIGSYRTVGLLGRGGMGAVYLAAAPGGQWVAIKVIRPELAQRPEFRARFRREAENARRVRRFATAAVLDAGTEGPSPYLVTEFVEGPTLARRVSTRGPLGHGDLEHLALSVATALGAIHAAGIVHRDLTPANVLLSPVGPKVIDFGLARAQLNTTTVSQQIGRVVGTPGYMAPEQILDEPITPAADVFAWGGVVIYAGTGRPPFGSGPTDAVLYRIVHEPPRLDGLPDELRGLVELALSRDPGARPSAEELREQLAGTGGVTAAPVPRSRPRGTGARRWQRRGRPEQTTTAVSPGPTSRQPEREEPVTVVTPAPAPAPPPAVPPRVSAPAPAPAQHQRPGRSRRTPLLVGTAVAGAVLVTAVGTTLTVTGGQRHTGVQATTADSAAISRELASRSDLARASDAVLAGRLALAAYQLSPTPEAGTAVIASFAARTALTTRAAGPGAVDVALSRSGERLVEAGADNRIRVWDLRSWLSPTATPAEPPAPASAIVASSPTASSPPTAPVLPAPLDLGAQGALAVAMRPDGAWVGWATADGLGHLVGTDLGSTQAAAGTLTGNISPIERITFSSDGTLLATVTRDGSVGVWDVSQPARPLILSRLTDHSAPVTDAALRPDGAVLATAGIDQKVQVWSLADRRRPALLAELTGHLGAVDATEFSADGRTLASVSGDDATLRRWDLSDPAHPRVLDSRRVTASGSLTDVVVGIHGSTATAADDGSAVVWSAPGPGGATDLVRLATGTTGQSRIVTDGPGTTFAIAGGGRGPVVFTVDPLRLTWLACAQGLGPDRRWWSREIADVPFEDPCRR